MSPPSAIPTALYRTYRPQHFRDLVGQDTVRTTLLGAITHHRLGHAYLFSGPRGTGKTSMARILARAATCQQPQDGEPCDACIPCRALLSGPCLDLVEIDAASHTSVDSVRDLMATLPYRPTLLRYKVIIIDECHGLSGPAFNALLKSLEEPADHLLFVLATTERHKVPPTVASRCQRLDFRPLEQEVISTRLAQVARAEGLAWTPAALDLLAAHATGSLRDALAALDQARTHTTGALTEETVRDALGLPPSHLVTALADAIVCGDVGQALAQTAQAASGGSDVRALWRALLGHFHHVLCRSADHLPRQGAPPTSPEVTAHALTLGTTGVLPILHALQHERTTRSWADHWHLDSAVAQACMACGGSSPLSTPSTAHRRPAQDVPSPSSGPPPPQPVHAALALEAHRPDAPQTPQEPVLHPQDAEPAAHIQTPQKPRGGSAHDLWTTTLERLRTTGKTHTLIHAESGTPIDLTHDTITIAFARQLHKDRSEKPLHRSAIEEALRSVAGRPLHLICQVGVPPEHDGGQREAYQQQIETDLRRAYERGAQNGQKDTP